MKFKEIVEGVNPAQTKRAAAIYLLTAACQAIHSVDTKAEDNINYVIDNLTPGGDPGTEATITALAKKILNDVIAEG